MARRRLEPKAFRWQCEYSTTELPSHPVISPTTFRHNPSRLHFITVIDRVNIFIFLFLWVLRVSLAACDVYNITFRPLHIFTDFFDICHKQMLIYNYIIFVQLSVKERVKYKQCLNSLRTALVDVVCWIMYCWASFIWHNRTLVNLTSRYYIMDKTKL